MAEGRDPLARFLHIDHARQNFSAIPTMIDRLEQDLRFTRAALNLRGYRQELLASNIANADTPHFKARDIDFKSTLENILGGGGTTLAEPLDLARTHRSHIAGEGTAPYANAAKYRIEYQGAVDGNTVNMDVERAAFTENSLQMEAMMTFINSRLRTMNSAIQAQ